MSLFGNQPPPSKKLGPQDPPSLADLSNTGGGGLFGGNNNNNNNGGGLFGNNNNNNNNTGGGLFGGNNNNTNTGGGLFGNNNNNNTGGGGLFGNNNNNGGLFGNNNSGGGLFGNNTGGSLFGNNNGGLFGNNNTGGGLFGNNNTGGSLFGNNNNINNTANQINFELQTLDQNRACRQNDIFYPGYTNDEILAFKKHVEQLAAAKYSLPGPVQGLVDVYLKYNPCSKDCAFTFFFYDKIVAESPIEAAKMSCADIATQKDWEQALKNNPKPGSLVPVMYRGFRGVGYRAEEIARKNASMKEVLKSYKSELEKRKDSGSLISAKLVELRKRQDALALRVLKVATGIMTSSNTVINGSNMSDDEEVFSKLEMLRYRMASAQVVKEKAQELSFKKDRIRVYAGLAEERKRELVLNQETMEALSVHLMQQQKSILRLAQVVNCASSDVKRLEKGPEKKK